MANFLRACLQASRFVFSEINKRFPTMPFTMRLIEDSGRARLGLVRSPSSNMKHRPRRRGLASTDAPPLALIRSVCVCPLQVECLNHELLHPYPVLHEKGGDLVAHIKCTVLIMPNGVDRVCHRRLRAQLVVSVTSWCSSVSTRVRRVRR